MCPNCRAFITSADRICPYCETPVGARAIDRRVAPTGVVAGLIPQARFTTSMIMLVNFAMYLAAMLYTIQAGGGAFDVSGGVLFRLGAKYGPAIAAGEWWRLLTAGFLHGGLVHILMNSWVLFDLGSQVEEVYGSARLIVFYFVTTISGFLLSNWWSPGLSVGSSAGIFGLIGVMIALGIKHRSALGDHIRGLYTKWAMYGLLFGLLPIFRTDNAAHVGGLAAGLGIALLATLPNPFDDSGETIWKWLSYACLAGTAFAFVRMFLSFVRP